MFAVVPCLLQVTLAAPAARGATPPGPLRVIKLIAEDRSTGDNFGYSVAISGDTILVGAPYRESDGVRIGAAYVFRREGPGDWRQVAKLSPSIPPEADRLGLSVDIEGETAVVGSSAGTYVFERQRSGSRSWDEVARIFPADLDPGDSFGSPVAIDGQTLVVGHSIDDDAGNGAGAVYVFERHRGGADAWHQTTKLYSDVATTREIGVDHDFGWSVAIAGDRLVVGARGERELGHDSGAAYIFERDGGDRDVWGRIGKLHATDGEERDRFGTGIATVGDTIVVGADLEDESGNNAGAAYVFEPAYDGEWEQVSKLLANDASSRDFGGAHFGKSVAIADDWVVAGAHWMGYPQLDPGTAYLFGRDVGGPNGWGQAIKLLAPDGADEDRFGYSVGIDSEVIVIGADEHWQDGIRSGAAYVFEARPCQLTVELEESRVTAGESLGVHLGLHHNRLRSARVPFSIWIEDERGIVVGRHTTPERDFEFGDETRHAIDLPIPVDTPGGAYRLYAGVGQMQQGRTWTVVRFQVR